VTGERMSDQELSHPLIPISKDKAARQPLVGEIETVIIVPWRHPVEEIKAEIVLIKAARVVVDDIKQNGDAPGMAEIDQGAELVVGAGGGAVVGLARLVVLGLWEVHLVCVMYLVRSVE